MKNAERTVRKVAEQYHLMLPVPITSLPRIPGMRYTGTFDAISLKHWCEFLVTYNVWHVMCGLRKPDPARCRSILTTFWERYRTVYPNHSIWSEIEEHRVDLGQCCPVLLHGDEGRGRKKQPFLIMAYHSFIGFGTRAANDARTHRSYNRMRLNYLEDSTVHRMLTCVLPKMTKDDVALQALFRFITSDSLHMMRKGIESPHGGCFFMAVLGCTGDWAFLAKAGNLSRTYSMVEKRPRGARSVPKGICHYCRAGQTGLPFEDFRRTPLWKPTCFEAGDRPFTEEPVLLQIPHEPARPAAFFVYDLWHSFHLGMGKSFTASIFALISDRMPSGNIDGRFAELTDLYLQWCDETRRTPFVTTITKESVGWIYRNKYPNGFWNKGHVTVTFLKFISHWLGNNNVADCAMLSLCIEGVKCIDNALESLYKSDIWLSQSVAHSIGQNGLRFVEIYGRLVRLAFDRGVALWALMPKSHVIHHIFAELSEAGQWIVNPAVYAVQISEDFVGKKSRLSRRVHPTQAIRRVLERSLMAARKNWVEAKFLPDG